MVHSLSPQPEHVWFGQKDSETGSSVLVSEDLVGGGWEDAEWSLMSLLIV